jgi:hypothetical protein
MEIMRSLAVVLVFIVVVMPATVSAFGLLRQGDSHRLPVGDGRISTTPVAGSVWACTRTFGGGGAFQAGPWFFNDGFFDLSAKTVVQGAIEWPHQFEIESTDDVRIVRGNGLPDHPTGQFPIASDDDAYQYDRNPNRIRPQSLEIQLPQRPVLAAAPSCAPQGAIGVLLSGSVFFNALDARGDDAVAHEIQDQCQGHPERTGAYHYHSLTPCLAEGGPEHSSLVGYAFDGFGLYGRRGEAGLDLTNVNLDECHGHTHEVVWDGQATVLYHYHATWEYPYTLGCYRGTPTR